MAVVPEFGRSVFINCPFDEQFEPILQAILFCVVYLDFNPRIARERSDSGEVRVEKIIELIEQSQYSIHDLSRDRAVRAQEYYRLNMPFELGMDHGCRRFKGEPWTLKKFLILSNTQYNYQKSLSDIDGNDIETHSNRFDIAVKKVRNWLVNDAGADNIGARLILNKYSDFQEWYFEKHRAAGADDDDIKEYPTREFLDGMIEWKAAGQPVTYP